ncbi:MAG TPA: YIP1 family protein [Candidatus Baltobacteraceae bacterium]|nr:YIP1 family protein [Candidatus Baltobacteraceae bacterium]
MSVSTSTAPKVNGANTALNVITAPREAFETLRTAPTWGWALLISAVLGAIGQYLATPATVHAFQMSWPAQVAANPALAGMSPEQQQNQLNIALGFVKWSWLFSPITLLIACLLTAVVMLIFKAIGRGDAGFKQLWCASVNISIVSFGIYSLINGLIAMVRGASSYGSMADAYRAMPSLAWLVPGAGLKMTAFLAPFNVTGIWSAVLVAMAMIYVARTSKAIGAACGVAVLVVSGALIALFAR